jgi:gas vesicle protein
MQEKLTQLLQTWQTFLPKVKNKLSQLTETIRQKNTLQTQLNEANRKLEFQTKENTENEKVLNQIFTEM